MSMVSATEFNQRPSRIKAMAAAEPVFVTERGEPTAVVISIAEYRRMREEAGEPEPKRGPTLAEAFPGWEMSEEAEAAWDEIMENVRDRSLPVPFEFDED
ncbi:MAG: type II toxin-antitoxin system prevent-host-death family antitoxin [Cellulomonadaceae bacterium]|jgi:prevent-host-death family protein|nr:type II toxin-antitoxin system prevent-host-death family antitoxin [Cellulomonadaceae bacterium]